MSTVKNIIFFTIIIIVIFSCSKAPNEPTADYEIYGAWVEAGIDSNLSVFHKSLGLDSTKMGWIFYDDGKLIERNNAGWCGTPPIFYKNYEGNWKFESNNTIKITVGYWGGIRNYSFRIVSLDSKEMKIMYLWD